MSNYTELVTILKELLFNRFYPKPQYIRGLLGDGRGNVLVPERPDYNYVRFSRASSETFEVFNKEVSQPVDGWPVLLGEFPWQEGLFQVVATDWSAYAQTGWGDEVASIQAHAPTHEWPNFTPGSDPLNVYLRAMTPMRTQAAASGSTSVMVTAYEYDGPTGTNYGWPGLPELSLGAATPASGTMRYMGVYLNPATNTLGVVTGSTTIFTDALEPPRPVWPRGVMPTAYVRLYGGQSQINERDIRDARRLWENTLVFTGTVGLPTPIITGSYLGSLAGTPTWTNVTQLAAPDGSPSPAWAVDNTGNLSNPGGGILSPAGVPYLVNENKLYHSLSHDIWLEGTTFNDVADDTYVATLWNALHNGQAPDVTGEAGGSTDPFARCLRCTFDSASSQAGFVEFFKNKDTVELRGKAVSISADLWGTNVSNLRMAVAVWTGTGDGLTSDMVGTWGAGNPTLATDWAYIGTPASIAITSTRTRYKVENLTIPTNANNIGVFIWTPDSEASGDLFNIARVKLEEGQVATDFPARDYALELFLVEHFARILDASSNLAPTGLGTKVNTTAIRVVIQFATMRTTPALSHNVTAYTAGNPATTAVALVNMITNSFYAITGALTLSAFTANKNMVLLNFVAGTSWDGTVGDLSNARLGPDVVIMFSARL